jgi:hypothetical protein
MAKKLRDDSGDLAERSLRYTRDQFDELVNQTGDYVRANPTQSILYAFVAGYILNRLPFRRILSGVVRLLLFALKPAILVYGAMKLYQAIEEEE